MRPWRSLPIALPAFLGGLLLGVAGTGIFAATMGSARFSDIPAGAPYDEAVGELTDAGILEGNPDGTFTPDVSVTRGDLALILKRLRDELLKGGKTKVRRNRSLKGRTLSPTPPPPSPVTTPQPVAAERPKANPAGTLRFTLGKATVKEEEGTVSVSIVRVGGKRGKITVEYALVGGTAKPGEDYEQTAGTLTLEDGETSKTFTVPIKDDAQGEASETFTVVLRNPTGGATLGIPSEMQVTIKDNEISSSPPPPPSPSSTAPSSLLLAFSAFAYEMAEDKGSVTLTVVRTGPSAASVAVNYATSDGSAKVPIDYTAASGTLTFAAGETSKTFTVALANDTVTEGNKTVHLKLSSPTGGVTLGTPSTATLTIVDTDLLSFTAGAFKFESSSYRGSEGDGFALITVRRVNGADGVASVQYATSDGGAKAGTDYTATSGTLTFAAGEAKKSFPIPLNDDLVSDPDEKVNLTLTSPTGGATLTDPSNAVLTIQE